MKFYKLPKINKQKNGGKKKEKKTSNFISWINWIVIGTLI